MLSALEHAIVSRFHTTRQRPRFGMGKSQGERLTHCSHPKRTLAKKNIFPVTMRNQTNRSVLPCTSLSRVTANAVLDQMTPKRERDALISLKSPSVGRFAGSIVEVARPSPRVTLMLVIILLLTKHTFSAIIVSANGNG